MSALDGVLADLIEADRDCAYVTIKREPLEALIDEWARRCDQVSLFCSLMPALRRELAQAWTARTLDQPPQLSASQESTLRVLDASDRRISRGHCASSACCSAGACGTAQAGVALGALPMLARTSPMPCSPGTPELAERLESERQTVRRVMSTIDAVVDRLIHEDLVVVSGSRGRHPRAGGVIGTGRVVCTLNTGVRRSDQEAATTRSVLTETITAVCP